MYTLCLKVFFIAVKEEKISLPSDPVEPDSQSLNIEIKQEVHNDQIAMPPPVAPVPSKILDVI